MKSALEILREIRAQADLASAEEDDVLGQHKLLDIREEPIAYRLYSRRLDRELWLAKDEETAADLAAEFPGIPVLTFAEVVHLKDKPPELLEAILDTKVEFPDARLCS